MEYFSLSYSFSAEKRSKHKNMRTEDFIKTHMFKMDENHKNVGDYICINQGALEEALNSFAKLKCQELLLLVAEKVRIIEDGDVDNPYEEYFLDLGGYLRVDKDSILNAVDLETFCS